MEIQVLVATMGQTDHSLIDKMNIQSDAIVGNQVEGENQVEKFEHKGNQVQYYSFDERGVGLNRNNALLRADKDILTFADDDMKFVDGYHEIIKKAFEDLPQADAIIFATENIGRVNKKCEINKIKRIRMHNSLKWGTYRLSVRRISVKRENISFHTFFGGGTLYAHGEDSIFIVDMLKAGLKIYTYPACIATVDQTQSTWFKGYNKKYLHDKGALFSAISKKYKYFLCIQDLIRHPNIYRNAGVSIFEALQLMRTGMSDFKTLTAYKES